MDAAKHARMLSLDEIQHPSVDAPDVALDSSARASNGEKECHDGGDNKHADAGNVGDGEGERGDDDEQLMPDRGVESAGLQKDNRCRMGLGGLCVCA